MAAVPGRECLFRDLADATYALKIPKLWLNETWDEVQEVKFSRPDYDYDCCPSTKAADCLMDEFGLEPIGEMFKYEYAPSPQAVARADEFAAAHSPYVLIHPHSESSNIDKNLTDEETATAIDICQQAGFKPVMVDFGGRFAKWQKSRQDIVWLHKWHGWGSEWRCPSADLTAALIARARAVIGIDSGVEHLAGTTTTPTIVVWRDPQVFHPVHFFDLSPNVLHLIQYSVAPLMRTETEQYFQAHYRHEMICGVTGWIRERLAEVLTG